MLARYGLARLRWLDRGTGRAVRRYEHAAPGDLVHVDIKKLGRIPDGGGWKIHGRTVGNRHNKQSRPGYAFLHNAVDDHSRLAYTEIPTDERKETAAGFWTRANAYFAACGITVTRVLTDNGSCYRSRTFAAALGRQDHPQANLALPAADQRQGRTLQPHHARQASPPSRPGYTSTITTGATPHSAAPHPPAASPTSRGRTASHASRVMMCRLNGRIWRAMKRLIAAPGVAALAAAVLVGCSSSQQGVGAPGNSAAAPSTAETSSATTSAGRQNSTPNLNAQLLTVQEL